MSEREHRYAFFTKYRWSVFFELELALLAAIDVPEDDAELDIRQFSSSSFCTSMGNALNTSGSTLDGRLLSVHGFELPSQSVPNDIDDGEDSARDEGFAGVDVDK